MLSKVLFSTVAKAAELHTDVGALLEIVFKNSAPKFENAHVHFPKLPLRVYIHRNWIIVIVGRGYFLQALNKLASV